MCNDVAIAHASAAVIETLETRRLLTADLAGVTSWDLIDDDGVSQGSATLEDGILKVTATDGNDEMRIGTLGAPGRFYVMVNRASVMLEVAAVRGVVIDAGAGNDALDFFNFGGVLDLPVRVYGGDGNDSLVAQRDRNNYDDPIAFMNGGPFAPTTLIGGAGDDDLHAGIGDCYMDGGPGNDTFEHGWGHDKIRDRDKVKADKPAEGPQAIPPAPAPALVGESAKPATDDHAAATAGVAVTVLPTAFSVTPVMADADRSLLHGVADDPLTA
jgi:Ca2+-binding RTX toxin-like protein